MTAQQGATRAVGKSDAWSWPIDRSRYDRTPALGAAEYAALAERVRRSDAGHALSPARLCPALERLVRPLSAALDLTRALPSVRREGVSGTSGDAERAEKPVAQAHLVALVTRISKSRLYAE